MVQDAFFYSIFTRAVYARYRFLPSRPLGRPKVLSGKKNPHLLLLTIAFNKPDLIDKQAEQISLNVKDQDYRYIVVDNSTDKAARAEIKEVCQRRGVEYIAVPRGLFQNLSKRLSLFSISHGFALNWLYYRIIRKIKPEFFAFLDHDIFPIVPCTVADLKPEEDFYGMPKRRGTKLQYWFMWPGWSVYRFKTIDAFHPDFNPAFLGKTYLDTGGANYSRIYSKYDASRLRFAPLRPYRLRKDDSLSIEEMYYGWTVEIVDNAWLHLVNGSDYRGYGTKHKMVKACLQNIESFQRLLEK